MPPSEAARVAADMDYGSQLRAFLDPSHYNSLRPIEASGVALHPNLSVMHQGTNWHRAGVIATPEQHAAIRQAERAIFPDGLSFTDARIWSAAAADTIFCEYRCAGETWNGIPFANGGLAIFEFDEGSLRRVRNFLNTAHVEQCLAGWADQLPVETLLHLPGYHSAALPPIDWRPWAPSPSATLGSDPTPVYAKPLTHGQRAMLHFGRHVMGEEAPFPVSPDGYTDFQGTCWVLAGRSPAESLSMDPASPYTTALIRMFTPPGQDDEISLAFTHFSTWDAADDSSTAFMEWVSQATFYTGRTFRNHGATVLTFDDRGNRVAHREYTNTAYAEAMTNDGDFRALAGDAFEGLAAAADWDLPSSAWHPLPIGP